MNEIYRNMGGKMFRRAFRMSFVNFKKLYLLIKPALLKLVNGDNVEKDMKKIHPVNGVIPLPVRLGCSLRFWAGGDPYNLHLLFGISYTKIFKSINYCLNAINQTPSLDIKFPTNHDHQRVSANGF